MSGSLSTTATSSMRPPITAGPISRKLSVLSAAARSGGGVVLGGAAAAKKRQIAAASMAAKISLTGLMLVADAVADHFDEFFEVERFKDGVAHGVGRDLLHAALARGGEDDNVRPA